MAFELAQAEKQRRHARALSTRSLAVRRQLMRLVFDEDRVRVRCGPPTAPPTTSPRFHVMAEGRWPIALLAGLAPGLSAHTA